MTRDEFRITRFNKGMIATYKDAEYYVVGLNFDEDLLGLADNLDDNEADLLWVRCESIELIID